MKSKKADGGTIGVVVAIVLLLFFLAIYTGAWKYLFGKGVAGINENLASAGDKDNDGIINIEDKCPCVSGIIENHGCQDGYEVTGTGTGNENRDCLGRT